jgi:hypothetical protein
MRKHKIIKHKIKNGAKAKGKKKENKREVVVKHNVVIEILTWVVWIVWKIVVLLYRLLFKIPSQPVLPPWFIQDRRMDLFFMLFRFSCS